METNDAEWINKNLDEVKESTDSKFRGTVFLSTDNKMTVSVEADTKEGRSAALKWAKEVYDRLIYTYGSKQRFAAQEYKAADENKPSSLGNCINCGAPNKWSEKKQKTYCSALCWKK